MTDPTKTMQSIRTILEMLILFGVLWLGTTSVDQGKATIKLQTQIESLTIDLQRLSIQLADVPHIAQTLATMQVKQDEHERRISNLESLHVQQRPRQ